jgi:hypothetical protein
MLAAASTAYGAGVNTDSVTSSGTVTGASGAVGTPIAAPGSNFGEDITPFTPAFDTIAVIGDTTAGTGNSAAAQLTLHFAQPVVLGPGKDIGVFTNTGLSSALDLDTGTLTAAPGPITFSSIPQQAIVSVSEDGNIFVPLNGGNPIDLGVPSNQFLDSQLDPQVSDFGVYVDAAGGTQLSDPFKPFDGTLADFSGETYPQMLAMLGGSFGGAWIDASPSGLAQINYVRFDVPQGADYRLVLDAVTAVSAVPEPASLGVLSLGLALIARRRTRRS